MFRIILLPYASAKINDENPEYVDVAAMLSGENGSGEFGVFARGTEEGRTYFLPSHRIVEVAYLPDGVPSAQDPDHALMRCATARFVR